MFIYHLECLGSFMDVPNITLHQLNALSEWEDRLFELLLITVCKTNMVV